MKRNIMLVVSIVTVMTLAFSCKTVARLALKYWTRKQVKEFVRHCEDKTSPIVGSDNAHKYCDCAVDVVAEAYKNYDDIKDMSIIEVLKVARDCRQ